MRCSGANAARQTRTSAARLAAFEPAARPSGHEREAGQHERVPCQVALGDGRSNRGEICGARDAVDERDAVQQQRRCERAEQEVLDRGLVCDRPVDGDPHQDIGTQDHELQPEVEDEEIHGGRGQHHAGRRQKEERVVLGRRNTLRVDMFHRQQRGQREGCRKEHLEKARVPVARDRAAEPDPRGLRREGPPRHDRGHRGDDDRDRDSLRTRDMARDENEHQCRACEHELGQEKDQIAHSGPAMTPDPAAVNRCPTEARRKPSTNSG